MGGIRYVSYFARNLTINFKYKNCFENIKKKILTASLLKINCAELRTVTIFIEFIRKFTKTTLMCTN
jgi:hypothetical protein